MGFGRAFPDGSPEGSRGCRPAPVTGTPGGSEPARRRRLATAAHSNPTPDLHVRISTNTPPNQGVFGRKMRTLREETAARWPHRAAVPLRPWGSELARCSRPRAGPRAISRRAPVTTSRDATRTVGDTGLTGRNARRSVPVRARCGRLVGAGMSRTRGSGSPTPWVDCPWGR
jgi:hypothetical protein